VLAGAVITAASDEEEKCLRTLSSLSHSARWSSKVAALLLGAGSSHAGGPCARYCFGQEQKRVRGLREGVESVGIVEKQRPGEGRGRALLFARRESRPPNRSRYSIPSKRRGRYGNAPRAITREVSNRSCSSSSRRRIGWLAANSFAIFDTSGRERSRVVGVLALRPEHSAQVRMPPTAPRAPRGERPGPTGF